MRAAACPFAAVLCAVQRAAEFMRAGKVARFTNARRAVCLAAAARQQHASVGKADIIHQRKAVIAHRLLKRPEQIVRRRHQKLSLIHI